jgi:hypothetical protein
LYLAVAEAEFLALPYFDDPNLDKVTATSGVLQDDSPYPEVRSAVANTDDPDIPVSTLRCWILGKLYFSCRVDDASHQKFVNKGLAFAVVIPGLNQFFFFRFPSVTIGPVSLILTEYL